MIIAEKNQVPHRLGKTVLKGHSHKVQTNTVQKLWVIEICTV